MSRQNLLLASLSEEDWPRHRKTCVNFPTGDPPTGRRSAAKFCRERILFRIHKFVEGMVWWNCAMQPKGDWSMRADARDVVVARNEEMQLSSKSYKNSGM
jgi:hypothetical protein